MKSAVLHKVGGPFAIEEVELLPPRKGEVRVKLKAAGLCHSTGTSCRDSWNGRSR